MQCQPNLSLMEPNKVVSAFLDPRYDPESLSTLSRQIARTVEPDNPTFIDVDCDDYDDPSKNTTANDGDIRKGYNTNISASNSSLSSNGKNTSRVLNEFYNQVSALPSTYFPNLGSHNPAFDDPTKIPSSCPATYHDVKVGDMVMTRFGVGVVTDKYHPKNANKVAKTSKNKKGASKCAYGHIVSVRLKSLNAIAHLNCTEESKMLLVPWNPNITSRTPLHEIPMGPYCAKIMVNFGDGDRPEPLAVRRVLEIVRKQMQTAIKDARALRRRQVIEYQKARAFTEQDKALTVSSKRKKESDFDFCNVGHFSIGAENLFQAIQSGYDRLSYESPCGFDVAQLYKLFPGEMACYERWRKMKNYSREGTKVNLSLADKRKANRKNRRASFVSSVSPKPSDSEDDDVTKEIENLDDDDDDDDDRNNDNFDNAESIGAGALDEKRMFDAIENKPSEESSDSDGEYDENEKNNNKKGERLDVFDKRTTRMTAKWYMKFSDTYRQGTFLPNNKKDKSDPLQGGPRKKRKISSWSFHRKTTQRFLHWLGFDPGSSLPPPGQEVANALAFLAHDCVGRIVESSITLLLESQPGVDPGEAKYLDVPKGFQLRLEDIENACKSTHMFACPLNSGGLRQKKYTLYTGPGCEDRLEAEVEQLAAEAEESEIKDSEGNNSSTNERKTLVPYDGFTKAEQDTMQRHQLEDDELFARLDTSLTKLKPHGFESNFYLQEPLRDIVDKNFQFKSNASTRATDVFKGKATLSEEMYENLFGAAWRPSLMEADLYGVDEESKIKKKPKKITITVTAITSKGDKAESGHFKLMSMGDLSDVAKADGVIDALKLAPITSYGSKYVTAANRHKVIDMLLQNFHKKGKIVQPYLDSDDDSDDDDDIFGNERLEVLDDGGFGYFEKVGKPEGAIRKERKRRKLFVRNNKQEREKALIEILVADLQARMDQNDLNDEWIRCCKCQKWRVLPKHMVPESSQGDDQMMLDKEPTKNVHGQLGKSTNDPTWECSDSNWSEIFNKCEMVEQVETVKISGKKKGDRNYYLSTVKQYVMSLPVMEVKRLKPVFEEEEEEEEEESIDTSIPGPAANSRENPNQTIAEPILPPPAPSRTSSRSKKRANDGSVMIYIGPKKRKGPAVVRSPIAGQVFFSGKTGEIQCDHLTTRQTRCKYSAIEGSSKCKVHQADQAKIIQISKDHKGCRWYQHKSKSFCPHKLASPGDTYCSKHWKAYQKLGGGAGDNNEKK